MITLLLVLGVMFGVPFVACLACMAFGEWCDDRYARKEYFRNESETRQ